VRDQRYELREFLKREKNRRIKGWDFENPKEAKRQSILYYSPSSKESNYTMKKNEITNTK